MLRMNLLVVSLTQQILCLIIQDKCHHGVRSLQVVKFLQKVCASFHLCLELVLPIHRLQPFPMSNFFLSR
ncbi:hypothetical protein LINPERPRIM_LOCUS25124 [Linum perenne]